MRQAFNFYSSYDEVISDLNDKQLSQFMRSLLDVQFFREHIDSVSFEDKILSIVWKASKHSIKKQIEGYCNANKIDYNSMFYDVSDAYEAPLQAPCEAGLKGASVQVQEEEQGEVQVQEEEQMPAWLDKYTWNEWVQFRKDIKKKMTKKTIGMQLDFLSKHINNHVAIINQSIQNGWTGLFELKQTQQKSTYAPVNGMRANDMIKEIARREKEDELKNAIG